MSRRAAGAAAGAARSRVGTMAVAGAAGLGVVLALGLGACATSPDPVASLESAVLAVAGESGVVTERGCPAFDGCRTSLSTDHVTVLLFDDPADASAAARRLGTDGRLVGTSVVRFDDTTLTEGERVAYVAAVRSAG